MFHSTVASRLISGADLTSNTGLIAQETSNDSNTLQRISHKFAVVLVELLSSLPGTWIRLTNKSEGEVCFESHFGGQHLIVGEGNKGVGSLLSLLNTGVTAPIYFNPLGADRLFDSTQLPGYGFTNKPLVIIQGRLPAESVSDNVVYGPSPFCNRMLLVHETAQDIKRVGLKLEHIERIALRGPELTSSTKDKQWAEQFIELVDALAILRIEARLGSQGLSYQNELRQLLS